MRFPNRAVDTPLAQKQCVVSAARVRRTSSCGLCMPGEQGAHGKPALGRSLRPAISPGTVGTMHIRMLLASEMSSFLPLDCARVKLSLALIKTCQHLELGPTETCHPSYIIIPGKPTLCSSFHSGGGGAGGASPLWLAACRRGCLDHACLVSEGQAS